MSQFSGAQQRDSKTPTPSSSPPRDFPYGQYKTDPRPTTTTAATESHSVQEQHQRFDQRPATPPSAPSTHQQDYGPSPVNGSPLNSPARQRSTSRPLSMVQAYQPPLMDVNEDTIPELQPIFTFLNSHANKLYQEGYFLKLDDQNTRMLTLPRPPKTDVARLDF
jgi:CCR4-NOT transcriptional complex subunit CAF120